MTEEAGSLEGDHPIASDKKSWWNSKTDSGKSKLDKDDQKSEECLKGDLDLVADVKNDFKAGGGTKVNKYSIPKHFCKRIKLHSNFFITLLKHPKLV